MTAERYPLGDFLREEMDERGWDVADAVERMSGDPVNNTLVVQAILVLPPEAYQLGKEVAKRLAEAFEVSAQTILALDLSYREWSAEQN